MGGATPIHIPRAKYLPLVEKLRILDQALTRDSKSEKSRNALLELLDFVKNDLNATKNSAFALRNIPYRIPIIDQNNQVSGTYTNWTLVETYFNDPKNAAVEIRSIPSPNNFEQMNLYSELFTKRLQFLQKLSSRNIDIELYPSSIESFQQLFNMYYLYVTQSGLEFQPYQQHLPFFLKSLSPSQEILNATQATDYQNTYLFYSTAFNRKGNRGLPFGMGCWLFLNKFL